MFEEELREIDKKISRLKELLVLAENADGESTVTTSFKVYELSATFL